MTNLLTGRWYFIAAEELSNFKWTPSTNYVDGMTWDFMPEYIGTNKAIGTLIEHSPRAESIRIYLTPHRCYSLPRYTPMMATPTKWRYIPM